MPMFVPEVSVIIPMFNAEKYLAECLESLLAQSFKNFEVIIVDDCSTDSSCAIVESYAEKFGGRLILSHMEKNTGSGALPRNKGLALSRGEYIFNMDNDDLLTPTAIEELYTLAKDYDAEIVYCEKYFMSSGTAQEFKKNVHLADSRIQNPPFVDKPLFEPEDLSERVKNILNRKFWVAPWLKLIRRNLLIENNLLFPNLLISDDDIWTYALIFCAKKFLRVPNMVYIRRMREDSLSFVKRTSQKEITFWINPVLLGLKSFDDLMNRHKFFRQNLQYRYALLENFVATKFSIFFKDSFQLQPFEFYETVKQEFSDKLGEYDVLISALCTALNTQQKINAVNQQKFQQFAAHAQGQFKKFNQFAEAANNRIAELEAELKRLKS